LSVISPKMRARGLFEKKKTYIGQKKSIETPNLDGLALGAALKLPVV